MTHLVKTLTFVFLFLVAGTCAQAQTAANGNNYGFETTDRPHEMARPATFPADKSLEAHPPHRGNDPMLTLGPKNKPLSEPIKQTIKYDYYECNGIVADWFKELMVAEMNYFADINRLSFIKGNVCVIAIGTTRSLTPGRIAVHFYGTEAERNDCINDEKCPSFRSVNLTPKNNVLYRSYFLSDMNKRFMAQYCVTAKGKLFSDTTCYSVP
jgi:hypothetical protein